MAAQKLANHEPVITGQFRLVERRELHWAVVPENRVQLVRVESACLAEEIVPEGRPRNVSEAQQERPRRFGHESFEAFLMEVHCRIVQKNGKYKNCSVRWRQERPALLEDQGVRCSKHGIQV